MRENEISGIVLETSLAIHRQYGPGLFESVYEEILAYELAAKSLYVERQKGIPLVHHGLRMEVGFRADLLIENKVIIELKSVEKLADLHFRQVLTYVKLSQLKLGLLINFNVTLLKDGFHRIVNRL
jgi:GxxExxY protein